MRIILSFLFAFTSIAAFTQPGKPSGYTEIIRKKYSVSYPKSWTADSSKGRSVDISFKSPKSDSLDKFRENMNVIFMDVSGQNYTLAKMGAECEAEIKKSVQDVNIITSKVTRDASLQYYSLSYSAQQGDFSFNVMQRVYLKNNTAYITTFTLESGKEADFQALIANMQNSFKIH